MLVVALTGGIGSGKSLVVQYFSELGARVIDADQLARAAIERGSSGFDEVVATFGDSILKNGDIDRKALGDLVFEDPQKLLALNRIVHPRVRELFESAVSLMRGDDILIYEIPLLFESGASPRFDYVITVESSDLSRRERLLQRGLKSYEIDARIAAQASNEQRASISDFVLRNDSSQNELLRAVEHLWEDVFPPLQRASD